MHLLTIPEPVNHGPLQIAAGRYLAEDTSGAQLLVIAGAGSMELLGAIPRAMRDLKRKMLHDETPRRILFMRAGGFGDLILLTPVLREIKRRWPSAHLAVSTMSHYAQVLHHLPFVDELLPYPLPQDVAETYDAWVFLENAVERNPRAREIHMTEVFAEVAGVTVEDLHPAYALAASEGVWAAEKYPRDGKRRACIQVAASGRCRNYPGEQMGEVARTLANRGWEIFLMGSPGQMPPHEHKGFPTIKNLVYAGHSFRQTVAIVAQSDCMIGPDSALIHAAGALGVPAVGLYAPFPWQLRTAHSPSVYSFQGNRGCASCFHHENPTRQDRFPPHCPSAKRGLCQEMGNIEPRGVIEKVEEMGRGQ